MEQIFYGYVYLLLLAAIAIAIPACAVVSLRAPGQPKGTDSDRADKKPTEQTMR